MIDRMTREGVRNRRGTLSAMALGTVLGLLMGASSAWADEAMFEEAFVFFELNNTDEDLGIHSKIDGDAWKKLTVTAPNGRQLLRVKAKGQLGNQGLTELFMESDEPTFDELSIADFLARFPEGDYEITGTTLEGDQLESTANLRHVMPAPPENVMISGQSAAEDCDADPLPEVGDPVVISWNPVTSFHPEVGVPGPIEVVGYQVVVEREEPSLLVLSVDLPPNVTQLEIPAGFIALADEFKFEVLVREASGNQTAVESCFEIE